MKQWPEMITLLSEELTTSTNWPTGKIFVMDFAEKGNLPNKKKISDANYSVLAPEYLTQFGLVKQFAMKVDTQSALAPIIEKLPNMEEILVEPECMRNLKSFLASYRKQDFLLLTSKIIQILFRKFQRRCKSLHL